MNPCISYCLTKFGQEYTEKCDKFCDYAKAVKEKNEVIDRVLEIVDGETKQTNVGMEERYKRGYTDACRFIRYGIERLKGEQE